MRDRLSALPDEILCSILSFLSIRNSLRTRTLSSRWRYLSDYRPLLVFDGCKMLGVEYNRFAAFDAFVVSKFVRAVDHCLQIWYTSNLCALKICFRLDNTQASHIDRWVQTCVKMQIQDLELNFLSPDNEIYVLSDQLFGSENTFHIKCLRLSYCSVTFSSWCTTWINCLTTLELREVPLSDEEINCVLSHALNLTSLRLSDCSKSYPGSISVELPRLKILFLDDSIRHVELNCPKLDTLKCAGLLRNFIFSRVPLLTKVSLDFTYHPNGCSSIFDNLARHAPKLQQLSLCVTSEVRRLPRNSTMQCLKHLDINLNIPIGFDLFTITYFLKASPSLETLCLRLYSRQSTIPSRKRDYADFPLLKLKEVKIVVKSGGRWNEMELARYLLKNALVLQRMVITENCHCSTTPGELAALYCGCSLWKSKVATALLTGIKTDAELVIKGTVFNKTNMGGR